MNIGQQFNGEFFKPIAGIYKITNTKNGRVYIGQSKSVQQRVSTHFLELQEGRHIIEDLQADWNQYGPYAFLVELVEQVFNDTLRLERERGILEQYARGRVDCYNRDGYLHKSKSRQWIYDTAQSFLDETRRVPDELERTKEHRELIEVLRAEGRKKYILKMVEDDLYSEWWANEQIPGLFPDSKPPSLLPHKPKKKSWQR